MGQLAKQGKTNPKRTLRTGSLAHFQEQHIITSHYLKTKTLLSTAFQSSSQPCCLELSKHNKEMSSQRGSWSKVSRASYRLQISKLLKEKQSTRFLPCTRRLPSSLPYLKYFTFVITIDVESEGSLFKVSTELRIKSFWGNCMFSVPVHGFDDCLATLHCQLSFEVTEGNKKIYRRKTKISK